MKKGGLMDCCKWEELGLLYSSGELDPKNTRDFDEHLKECEVCRHELLLYREVKKRFFSAHILGDAPSPAVDAEILRVCADARKRGTAFTLMPSFMRKALMPVALFALAFVSAGYIMWNMQNADMIKSAAIKESSPASAAVNALPSAQTVLANTASDSITDSANGLKENFAKSRGNLEGQGVIPVDLKNK